MSNVRLKIDHRLKNSNEILNTNVAVGGDFCLIIDLNFVDLEPLLLLTDQKSYNFQMGTVIL